MGSNCIVNVSQFPKERYLFKVLRPLPFVLHASAVWSTVGMMTEVRREKPVPVYLQQTSRGAEN
jgi:hypothetical protein